jgi:hypothetical protein
MALDSITQMPNLPITSAFKASLPAAPKGRIGPKDIAPAAEELSSAISTASQKVGEADVNIEKAKREEQAIGFEKRAEGKRKFVEDIEIMPERQAYKEVVKQERGMEFVPTRDTVQDIAGLFGLIGVVGMVIGKGNAMQAMGAMNGMMEGHRKGRQDLFKQESQQFEKNFKAMQAKVSAALADLQEALKVKQYDNEAGDLEIQAVLARSESPFLKAVKDKQGDAAVLERLKEAYKSVTVDMPRTINDLQEKADAKADAERRFKLQMEQRERMARLQREAAALKATQTKGEKPPAKDIILRNELRNTLIPKLQSAIPIIDRLNQEKQWNKLTSLLAIDPRVAEAEFKNDEEALSLIRTLAYFRSKEFETAGKALTRKEDQILAPIVRSDLRVYEGTRGALLDGLKTMQQEQIGLEAMYPYIKTYNQTLRGESADGGAALDIDAEREAAYEAIQNNAPINEVKARFKQRTGQGLGAGDEE